MHSDAKDEGCVSFRILLPFLSCLQEIHAWCLALSYRRVQGLHTVVPILEHGTQPGQCGKGEVRVRGPDREDAACDPTWVQC